MNHPLYFRFTDSVVSESFVALVAIKGRLLATLGEDGLYWFEGVNPGGLAERGRDVPEAYARFRRALLTILEDMAAEAGELSVFRREVESFFSETGVAAEDWDRARHLVRSEPGAAVQRIPGDG